MPSTQASTFADPKDIAAYKAAKARGLSEEDALKVGDNGVGSSRLGGIDTTKTVGVAIPPDVLEAQLGKDPAAWRKARVRVTIGDQTFLVPIVDEGPGSGPVSRGVGTDLSAPFAYGVGSKGMIPVNYEIVPNAGPDVTEDKDAFEKEQSSLRDSLPGKIPLPPEGANYKRVANAPEGSIYKRPGPIASEEQQTPAQAQLTPQTEITSAEPEEAAAEEREKAEQPAQGEQPQDLAGEQPVAQASTTPASDEQPTTPAPQNAVVQAPVSAGTINQIKTEAGSSDPETQSEESAEKQAQIAATKGQVRVIDTHSAAVAKDPNDQRVTRRFNPDTGSDRVTGAYFVPGDPVHEEMLADLGAEHRAKLPQLSQAIARGTPYHFLYNSAGLEMPEAVEEGEQPTKESRAFEYQLSPAQQRIAAKEGTTAEGEEEPPSVDQHVSMIPVQMAMTKGNDVMFEGFHDQAVANNATHLLRGAGRIGYQVPYTQVQSPPAGSNEPDLPRDVMGYMYNQANGYRGDGSQMLDENGQPHPLLQQNLAKDDPYIPHLLNPRQAEFIHAMMNIRPGAARGPTERPSFAERATWQRRVNEGYAGQLAGTNKLLETLDRKLPQVRQRRVKWVTDKNTGERKRTVKLSGPMDWTKGTLEPTWRQWHVKLMSHLGMPPIESRSIRETGAPSHLMVPHAPIFKQVAAQYEPHGPRPAPISGNPEVGAPLGAGEDHIDPTRVTSQYKTDEVHWMPTHEIENRWKTHDPGTYIGPGGTGDAIGQRYPQAAQYLAGNQPMNAPQVSVWDDGQIRFINGRHTFSAMRDAGHAQVPIALAKDSVKNAKKHGLIPRGGQPEPISGNPEVGAPAGTPNEPAQPGLLGGGDVGAEEYGSLPGGAGGIDFASPSVRENMTMKMAKLALTRPKSGHGQYRDFNTDLENAATQATGTTQPAMIRDALGSWKDGAENSLRMLYGKQDRGTRKLVNAIRGLHSAQKQVVNFHYDDEGPHAIAHMSFHHDRPEHVADLLDKHGLEYRTLEAPGKGERAWAHVIVRDPQTYKRIEKLVKGGHVHEGYYRNGHADFIGDENGEDREEAAKEYRRIIEGARIQADQNWRQSLRGRNAPDTPRPQEWWEPFAEHAEKSFQQLKAGDEVKKQLLARDLKAAKADRENISPEQQAERERVQGIAQDWISKNPELDPLAVHHHLYENEKVPMGVDPETGKPTKPTNEDIAAHFEERNPRLDYSNVEHQKKAAMALTHDIMHALAKNPASYGWYDSTVDKAMEKMAEIAPDIKTNQHDAMAMRLAMAVTSQGQKVIPNFETAYKIYRYWKQNGRFPVMDANEWNDQFGGGPKRDAMIKNMAKLNKLWYASKEEGGVGFEGLKKLLEDQTTVGDLKKNYNLNVSGEAVDHPLPGAAFMGPKIGIFYSNLNKNFDPTTMDLWFSRTLNRLAGNMFAFSPEALQKGGKLAVEDEDEDEGDEKEVRKSQLERLEDVMNTTGLTGVEAADEKKIRRELAKLKSAKNLTRLGAMEMAPTLAKYVDERHRFYQKSEGLEGSYHKNLKTEENLAAKNIDLNFHSTADAPRTSTERKQWRAIMEHVDNNLKDAGLNINNADKQALLWYLEQQLFQGKDAKSSMDYLDAAHVLVRKVKNGDI